MLLNEFVYSACQASKAALPDIPAKAVEFYGQCGEDIIVRSLLVAISARLGVHLQHTRYMEIGGNHPFATSATYLLAKSVGMRGIIVEANARLIDGLKKCRPNDIIVHGAVQDQDIATVMLSVSPLSEISSLDRSFVLNWDNGRVGEAEYVEVPALRITDLFVKYSDDLPVVYLSVDVEGMDLTLLRDMDFASYRPWIVQAEPSNFHIPGNNSAIFAHMKSVGYQLLAMTQVNMIFVDQSVL